MVGGQPSHTEIGTQLDVDLLVDGPAVGDPTGCGGAIDQVRVLPQGHHRRPDAGRPDGFTIESVYPDANVYGVDFSIMMQKIQQDLRKVGITVELKPEPFATWREQVNTDHVPLTAVYYAPDFFGSSQYVDVFGVSEGSVWANRAGADTAPDIIDRQIDDLLTRALAAPAGQKADALWFEAGERMADNRIIIPMVSPDLIFAYRPNIEGVRYSACCALVLSEISN